MKYSVLHTYSKLPGTSRANQFFSAGSAPLRRGLFGGKVFKLEGTKLSSSAQKTSKVKRAILALLLIPFLPICLLSLAGKRITDNKKFVEQTREKKIKRVSQKLKISSKATSPSKSSSSPSTKKKKTSEEFEAINIPFKRNEAATPCPLSLQIEDESPLKENLAAQLLNTYLEYQFEEPKKPDPTSTGLGMSEKEGERLNKKSEELYQNLLATMKTQALRNMREFFKQLDTITPKKWAEKTQEEKELYLTTTADKHSYTLKNSETLVKRIDSKIEAYEALFPNFLEKVEKERFLVKAGLAYLLLPYSQSPFPLFFLEPGHLYDLTPRQCPDPVSQAKEVDLATGLNPYKKWEKAQFFFELWAMPRLEGEGTRELKLHEMDRLSMEEVAKGTPDSLKKLMVHIHPLAFYLIPESTLERFDPLEIPEKHLKGYINNNPTLKEKLTTENLAPFLKKCLSEELQSKPINFAALFRQLSPSMQKNLFPLLISNKHLFEEGQLTRIFEGILSSNRSQINYFPFAFAAKHPQHYKALEEVETAKWESLTLRTFKTLDFASLEKEAPGLIPKLFPYSLDKKEVQRRLRALDKSALTTILRGYANWDWLNTNSLDKNLSCSNLIEARMEETLKPEVMKKVVDKFIRTNRIIKEKKVQKLLDALPSKALSELLRMDAEQKNPHASNDFLRSVKSRHVISAELEKHLTVEQVLQIIEHLQEEWSITDEKKLKKVLAHLSPSLLSDLIKRDVGKKRYADKTILKRLKVDQIKKLDTSRFDTPKAKKKVISALMESEYSHEKPKLTAFFASLAPKELHAFLEPFTEKVTYSELPFRYLTAEQKIALPLAKWKEKSHFQAVCEALTYRMHGSEKEKFLNKLSAQNRAAFTD